MRFPNFALAVKANTKMKVHTTQMILPLLPTGSEEREVLGVVAILPSCQDMKTIAL